MRCFETHGMEVNLINVTTQNFWVMPLDYWTAKAQFTPQAEHKRSITVAVRLHVCIHTRNVSNAKLLLPAGPHLKYIKSAAWFEPCLSHKQCASSNLITCALELEAVRKHC